MICTMIDKNTHARPENDEEEVGGMSFYKMYVIFLFNYVRYQRSLCANTYKKANQLRRKN